MGMDFNLLGIGNKGYIPRVNQLPDYLEVVSHTAVCTGDNKLFVAGGFDAGSGVRNTVGSFDIATGAWTRLANLPESVRSGALGYYNGKLLHAGGYDQPAARISAAIHTLNPLNSTWGTTSTPMSPGRLETAYRTRGNMLYLFGGASGVNARQDGVAIGLSTGTPSQAATPTHPSGIRKAGTALADNRYIYALGGTKADGAVSSAFWRLDLTTNQWAQLPDIPAMPTSSCSLIVLDSVIAAHYVAGGTNHIWYFDTGTNLWAYAGEFTSTIHGLVEGIAVGRSLYMVGGWDGTARHKKVSRFDF